MQALQVGAQALASLHPALASRVARRALQHGAGERFVGFEFDCGEARVRNVVKIATDKLVENAKSFFDSLASQKPTSIKGAYVKSISLSTTMGPGIKVENFVN